MCGIWDNKSYLTSSKSGQNWRISGNGTEFLYRVQISPTQLAKCGSILSFLDTSQVVHEAGGIFSGI